MAIGERANGESALKMLWLWTGDIVRLRTFGDYGSGRRSNAAVSRNIRLARRLWPLLVCRSREASKCRGAHEYLGRRIVRLIPSANPRRHLWRTLGPGSRAAKPAFNPRLTLVASEMKL